MSQRDGSGRRISVPDPAFIDQVGNIARSMYDQQTQYLREYREQLDRQIIEAMGVPPALLGTVTGRLSSSGPNISNPPRPAPTDFTSPSAFRREYLGTFPPHEPRPMVAVDFGHRESQAVIAAIGPTGEVTPIPIPPLPTVFKLEEDYEQLQDGEELDIVARTTTTTSRTRRRRTTGRATTGGPTTNPPIYIWAMQSSIPRNGGEYLQYEVRLNDDGSTSCNCPGWIFKKKTETRGCKHTRHVETDAKDFFERHTRGEQLPTTAPTEEQIMRAQHTKAGKKAVEAGENATIKFGRFVELD